MSQHLDQAAASRCKRCGTPLCLHADRCDGIRDVPGVEYDVDRLLERLASRERLLRNLADPTTATRIAGCWSRTLADVIARELAT